MTPLVSILIPAFNAESSIAETLTSAISQTWPRKEIIVVDDGSKDRTLEVARRFESSGVKVVSQPNQGAATARNNAYSLSKGDYIQWLDADDLLAPDKVSNQMKAVAAVGNPRVLLSSSFGLFMYRPTHARFTPSPLWCDLSPKEFLLRKLEHKSYMQTAVWLVSRELAEAAGPWNVKMLSDDDGEYFCRVLLASEAVRFVGASKVYYRSIGNQRLSYVGRSNKKLDALWGSMKLHIGYLRSLDDDDRVRVSCVTYLQNYVFDFYPARPDILEEMDQLAGELGGRLGPPRLSWKYSWIQSLFGWDAAQRAQLLLPGVKWSLIQTWDNVASRIGG